MSPCCPPSLPSPPPHFVAMEQTECINHRSGRRWGRNGCSDESERVAERRCRREGALDKNNAVSARCSRQRQTAFSWISDGSDNKSRGSLATLKFRKGFSTAVCAFLIPLAAAGGECRVGGGERGESLSNRRKYPT